jgi:hypothetical protein
LVLHNYCLYSLLNKIRDKGKTVSAWKRGYSRGKGGEGGRREGDGGGWGKRGVMMQTLYAHKNKRYKKSKKKEEEI